MMEWTIQTTERETEALLDLSEQMGLSPERIFIQALRIYQGISKGHFSLVENNSMSKVKDVL